MLIYSKYFYKFKFHSEAREPLLLDPGIDTCSVFVFEDILYFNFCSDGEIQMCTECFTFTQCTKTYHVSILAGVTESFGTGFGTSPFSDSCAFGAFWAFGIFVQIPDCPAPKFFDLLGSCFFRDFGI